MSKPRLILIEGLSGMGKTTLAELPFAKLRLVDPRADQQRAYREIEYFLQIE